MDLYSSISVIREILNKLERSIHLITTGAASENEMKNWCQMIEKELSDFRAEACTRIQAGPLVGDVYITYIPDGTTASYVHEITAFQMIDNPACNMWFARVDDPIRASVLKRSGWALIYGPHVKKEIGRCRIFLSEEEAIKRRTEDMIVMRMN